MAKAAVYKWDDLPKQDFDGGLIRRAGFRQDHGLLVFTWLDPKLTRLAPMRASFDKIILNFDGEQYVEIDGKAHKLTPRSMIRIPANAAHTNWPAGNAGAFAIEVHALDSDLLYLADWQGDFPAKGKPATTKTRAAEPFKGETVKDTTGIVYEWDKLKREGKYENAMMRTAFKSRGSLVTFNYIDPSIKKQPPHKHDFDQIIMIVDGTIRFYLDGFEPCEVGPRAIIRAAGDVLHAGGPENGKHVLNMDVFSPPRPDYVYLADYQGTL